MNKQDIADVRRCINFPRRCSPFDTEGVMRVYRGQLYDGVKLPHAAVYYAENTGRLGSYTGCSVVPANGLKLT